MISIVAAVSQNGVIGKDGKIPWKLPADLAYFKNLTMGHAIVMGRKTYDSIGKALPGRTNIVITRQKHFSAADCIVAHSLKDALLKAEGKEIFIIGGGEIYREAMPLADKLYLTLVEQDFEGDAFFPPLDTAVWKFGSRTKGITDEKNQYPYSFLVVERK